MGFGSGLTWHGFPDMKVENLFLLKTDDEILAALDWYPNYKYRLDTEAKGSTRYRNPRGSYRTRARSARVLWRREGFFTA